MNLKKIIVIPVFNDWRSLNKLLKKIDTNLKKKFNEIQFLIVNDNSSQKPKISINKYSCIKKIEILNLSENVGSQKAIAMGLLYLKKSKGDSIITIMDSDGEDDPKQVPIMIDQAMKNSRYVITSNRKSRKESRLIIFLYKLHLILTFLTSFKWISFGNFSSFHKKNLSSLLKDDSVFYAISSAIIKNCSIKREYAKRRKRYFDKSKLGLRSLIEHSLRVNAVFFKNILFNSLMYILFAFLFLPKTSFILIFWLLLIFNFLILFIKFKHKKNNISFIKKRIL